MSSMSVHNSWEIRVPQSRDFCRQRPVTLFSAADAGESFSPNLLNLPQALNSIHQWLHVERTINSVCTGWNSHWKCALCLHFELNFRLKHPNNVRMYLFSDLLHFLCICVKKGTLFVDLRPASFSTFWENPPKKDQTAGLNQSWAVFAVQRSEECADLHNGETQQQLHKHMVELRRANSSGQDSAELHPQKVT